jgi:hypothetical protein
VSVQRTVLSPDGSVQIDIIDETYQIGDEVCPWLYAKNVATGRTVFSLCGVSQVDWCRSDRPGAVTFGFMDRSANVAVTIVGPSVTFRLEGDEVERPIAELHATVERWRASSGTKERESRRHEQYKQREHKQAWFFFGVWSLFLGSFAGFLLVGTAVAVYKGLRPRDWPILLSLPLSALIIWERWARWQELRAEGRRSTTKWPPA